MVKRAAALDANKLSVGNVVVRADNDEKCADRGRLFVVVDFGVLRAIDARSGNRKRTRVRAVVENVARKNVLQLRRDPVRRGSGGRVEISGKRYCRRYYYSRETSV